MEFAKRLKAYVDWCKQKFDSAEPGTLDMLHWQSKWHCAELVYNALMGFENLPNEK